MKKHQLRFGTQDAPQINQFKELDDGAPSMSTKIADENWEMGQPRFINITKTLFDRLFPNFLGRCETKFPKTWPFQ